MEDKAQLGALVTFLQALAAADPALVKQAAQTLSAPSRATLMDAFSVTGNESSSRKATVSRKTKETVISVSVTLDGTGVSNIKTGLGFYDHMLTALSKHSLIDINLECTGDLYVDDHHTVEDCALALGQALDIALGDRVGIQRYGSAYAPLDEALSRCVIDFSGRPSADVNLDLRRDMVGQVSCEMLQHALQSLAMASRMTLHVDVLKGSNDHHRAESSFKAVALALRQAVAIDKKRPEEVASTKGSL